MVKLSSTEEENTEFLSSLWDTYKYLILLSLVLLGAGIFGWESWSQNRISNLQDSANMYESFINSLNDEDLDQKVLADQIIKKYPNTLYADLVTFHLAKISVEEEDLKKAEEHLTWILQRHDSKWGSDFDPIEATARLRLARVLIANDNSNKALEIINESKSMSSSLHEVKGDAEEKLGFYAEAKLSYLKALESNQSQSVEAILKMKLANLDT
jgi:predicted negative regulator of RcsB-dependent stress response